MRMKGTAVAVALALATSGCATLRENPVTCKVVATLIGGTLGAVGGGVGTAEIANDPDDGEIAAGAAAGLVAGGLTGYLIGHYVCPEPEPAPVAPPPPPPAPAKIVPPATERRGG